MNERLFKVAMKFIVGMTCLVSTLASCKTIDLEALIPNEVSRFGESSVKVYTDPELSAKVCILHTFNEFGKAIDVLVIVSCEIIKASGKTNLSGIDLEANGKFTPLPDARGYSISGIVPDNFLGQWLEQNPDVDQQTFKEIMAASKNATVLLTVKLNTTNVGDEERLIDMTVNFTISAPGVEEPISVSSVKLTPLTESDLAGKQIVAIDFVPAPKCEIKAELITVKYPAEWAEWGLKLKVAPETKEVHLLDQSGVDLGVLGNEKLSISIGGKTLEVDTAWLKVVDGQEKIINPETEETVWVITAGVWASEKIADLQDRIAQGNNYTLGNQNGQWLIEYYQSGGEPVVVVPDLVLFSDGTGTLTIEGEQIVISASDVEVSEDGTIWSAGYQYEEDKWMSVLPSEIQTILNNDFSAGKDPKTGIWEIEAEVFKGDKVPVYRYDEVTISWQETDFTPLVKARRIGEAVSLLNLSSETANLPTLSELGVRQYGFSFKEVTPGNIKIEFAYLVGFIEKTIKIGNQEVSLQLLAFSPQDGMVFWVLGHAEGLGIQYDISYHSGASERLDKLTIGDLFINIFVESPVPPENLFGEYGGFEKFTESFSSQSNLSVGEIVQEVLFGSYQFSLTRNRLPLTNQDFPFPSGSIIPANYVAQH